MEVNRPAQSQNSRKGKRAWRKNINIDDIAQGLEERREEIRVLGDTNDGELFTIDTEGDDKLKSKVKKEAKVLKSSIILAQRSKAPALNVERNKKKVDGVSGKEVRKLMELAGRVQGKTSSEARLESDGIINTKAYDVWGDEQASKVSKRKLREIQKPEILKKLSSTGWTEAKVVPKTLKEAPINIKEQDFIPEGGKSYNPSLESWKSLINEEYEKEKTKEEQKKVLEDQRDSIQRLIETLDQEEQDASSDDAEDSPDDEDNYDDLKLSVNKPTETIIKSKAQRNKERKHKERLELEAQLKELKKQITELQNLANIEKEVIAKEELLQQEIESSEKKNKKPKKLFKYNSLEDPLEVKLSNELSDSLRKLKPEGNLLYDQMRSLQNKGKIEARVPVAKRRRYTKKVTEKWTYKDFK